MNTNHLKRFAQEARKKLLEQVGARLSFVISTDSVELREKTEQIKQLRIELGRITKEQLIEKVAYSWFNRLMALRFMDSNDYQPLGIRIITPKEGYTIPELLDESKRGNIPEELRLNRQKVYDLLDNRIPSTNPQNEAFKELLIAACNHLHKTFPFLFEKISDYTELLLPDDLTSDFSIITDIREGMSAEDCKNVEIIGWLYQFYISEKKDEVFASKAKVKKEDIPAATQLFTPRWIVEYMVQNTVGKLWLQNRTKSRLREYMPYFIESASLSANNYIKINSPEEIKLADPACGSGHILVYAFDLFTKIYEEEGYNSSDIPKLILEKNLYGFEIDERAAQLSGLALMMKAREYQRRALKNDLKPNILCFQDLQINDNEIKDTLSSLNIKISDRLFHDLFHIQQATNFGSLIIPNSEKNEIVQLLEKICLIVPSADVFLRSKIDTLLTSLNQLLRLSEKYHCVVANPPYMGGGNMNNELSDYVKKEFPKSKNDLFSCFIDRSLNFVPTYGYCGLVTMESWMFLSSFEDFRKELLKKSQIHSLCHFGWHIMRIAFGTVSFILQNLTPNENFKGTYSYLEIDDIDKNTEKPKVFPRKDNGRYNIVCQKDFDKIPSSPLGYWLDDIVISKFSIGTLKDIGVGRNGITTGNNDRFLREWYEVCAYDLDIPSIRKPNKNWIPYRKGGSYQKWYGNNNLFLNWINDGDELKKNSNTIFRNPEYYFQEGITWSLTGSAGFGARLCEIGGAFDVNGMTYFPHDMGKLKLILSLLNSTIAENLLKVINPTLAFQSGNIEALPELFGNNDTIESIVESCVNITKEYHSSLEINWSYSNSRLLTEIVNYSFEETCESVSARWLNKFKEIRNLEEENNILLLKTHGLESCFNYKVSVKQVTLLRELISGEDIKIDLSLLTQEFVSYSVGCMFGRYSLDKGGLILANLEETLQDYLNKIAKTKNECNFLPDEDNIIPILDIEWFEDDIVGKFYQFLKVTFGDKNFNKNLTFIEENIGTDIRKYFIKDFYPEHIKRYKKRPIYWMFSSPKGAFNVLIYMHRYTPDTLNNILNKYLKEFIGKLKTHKEHLQQIQVNGSLSEKSKAIKENDSIDKMLIELQEYERDILYPLATDRIVIDLDDGVLVNYNKFGKAIKEVSGLNDPTTKKKVKEFDWIDKTTIK